MGTAEISALGGQPEWLQQAARVHSAYGNGHIRAGLLRKTDALRWPNRGERHERMQTVCVTPRGRGSREPRGPETDTEATRRARRRLVMLHMAQMARGRRRTGLTARCGLGGPCGSWPSLAGRQATRSSCLNSWPPPGRILRCRRVADPKRVRGRHGAKRDPEWAGPAALPWPPPPARGGEP